MKTCGNCGVSLDDKATKCTACGKAICKNCGNVLGTGVTKCPKCGEATIWGGLQSLGCVLTIIGVGIIILLVVFLVMC